MSDLKVLVESLESLIIGFSSFLKLGDQREEEHVVIVDFFGIAFLENSDGKSIVHFEILRDQWWVVLG